MSILKHDFKISINMIGGIIIILLLNQLSGISVAEECTWAKIICDS